MSMLAEKRTKKKYNLVPRGKPLYEDANNFGTKMLEKMGWSKGKGLGANENGSPDFIRITYKNDNIGIGFEDRDDGWTNHETHFEKLLKSLHNSKENTDVDEEENSTTFGFGFQKSEKIINKIEEDDNVPKLLSGESLEEKSKKSKARVHYKKFTRGKDLSQYSEKDLANIFGRKDLNKKVVVTSKTEVSNSEHNHGVMTIISETSVQDYFKAKMACLKNGNKGLNGTAIIGNLNKVENQSNNEDEEDAVDEGDERNAEVEDKEVSESEMSASKKKSKRKADQVELEFEGLTGDDNSKTKKLKKKNRMSNGSVNVLDEINLDDKEIVKLIDNEKPKKKKSKNIKMDLIEQSDQPCIQIEDSKGTNNEEDNSIPIETSLLENYTVECDSKKSKKKKRKYIEEEEVLESTKKGSENGNLGENNFPSDPQEYGKKKTKRKKCKTNGEDVLHEMSKNEDEASVVENTANENENKISNDLEKSNSIEGKTKRKKGKGDLVMESEEKPTLDNQTGNINETTLKKSTSSEVNKQNCPEGDGDKVKKSKKKNRKSNEENPTNITDIHKKDDNSQEEPSERTENVEIETETIKRKKHKKSKQGSEGNSLDVDDSLVKDQKKSKKDCIIEIEDPGSSKNLHEKKEKNYESILLSGEEKVLDSFKTKKCKRSKEKTTDVLASSNERHESNNKPKEEKVVAESVASPSTPLPPQDDVILYKITAFSAEKFRHTNINGFPGSNLNEIIGYGLTGKVSIEVIYTDKDQQNIANMWNTVIDKYKQMEEDENNKPRSINFKRFKKKKVFVKV